MDFHKEAKILNKFRISTGIRPRYYSNLGQPLGVKLEKQGSQLRENSVTNVEVITQPWVLLEWVGQLPASKKNADSTLDLATI